MKKFLEKLKNKQDLSFNESKDAFEILMLVKLLMMKYLIF